MKLYAYPLRYLLKRAIAGHMMVNHELQTLTEYLVLLCMGNSSQIDAIMEWFPDGDNTDWEQIWGDVE